MPSYSVQQQYPKASGLALHCMNEDMSQRTCCNKAWARFSIFIRAFVVLPKSIRIDDPSSAIMIFLSISIITDQLSGFERSLHPLTQVSGLCGHMVRVPLSQGQHGRLHHSAVSARAPRHRQTRRHYHPVAAWSSTGLLRDQTHGTNTRYPRHLLDAGTFLRLLNAALSVLRAGRTTTGFLLRGDRKSVV